MPFPVSDAKSLCTVVITARVGVVNPVRLPPARVGVEPVARAAAGTKGDPR